MATPKKSPVPAKPLISQLDTMGAGDIGDEMLAVAFTIEQGLLSSGAKPGVDYTHLDLFKLAQPFVLQMFKKGKMEYAYPADEVAPRN